MAKPFTWTPLGEVDHSRELSEGVIELPNSQAEKAGGHSVLAVRCKCDGTAQQGHDLQLKVKIASSLSPVVSDVDYVRLGVSEDCQKVEARKLTLSERTRRVGARTALPILVFVAALAALIAVLFSGLKDSMSIVTAALAIPAAIATIVKAIKQG